MPLQAGGGPSWLVSPVSCRVIDKMTSQSPRHVRFDVSVGSFPGDLQSQGSRNQLLWFPCLSPRPVSPFSPHFLLYDWPWKPHLAPLLGSVLCELFLTCVDAGGSNASQVLSL